MRVSEQQRVGLRGFLRACWSTAWLEYRNLRYYPSNLVLAGVQELTGVGVWYLAGRFLNTGASQAVQQYGGNYLAYVVIGVLLNQVCLAALNGPFYDDLGRLLGQAPGNLPPLGAWHLGQSRRAPGGGKSSSRPACKSWHCS